MKIENVNANSFGEMVANQISAMLAYWDKDLICRFANASYFEWFGKRREEMIGKIHMKELLGPLYDKNLPYILDALNGNIQTFEREIELPSGEIRHSLANYYPDVLEGKVRGVFVHVADVTPLKLLEKELVKSNEIINEQNKRLLNFSNIVSHNLKSYSSNFSSILDLYSKAESEEEKIQMFKFLQSISKGFSCTVSHLNEIVKTQYQAKIKPERINLHAYIERIIDILKIQIVSNNAVIRNNVSPEVSLFINPAYMESILLNLLTNAIKYRHPDRKPVIDLDCLSKNNKTVLSVKDNGLGIDLGRHGKDLFGMYKTFHGNSDAEGVGLFITKYQIETIGGQIEVESKEDLGSTFRIYFNS